MSAESGHSGDPLPFCLLCNSTLKGSQSNDVTEEQAEQGLVLVSAPGSAEVETEDNALLDIAQEMEEVHGEGPVGTGSTAKEAGKILQRRSTGTKTASSGLGDAEWIRKYQGFLSKTLHLNMEDFIDEDDHGFRRVESGMSSNEQESLLFCNKCKAEVENFYQADEQVRLSTKAFEDLRDNIAASIARTFVDQKLQAEEALEDVEMEDLKISTTESLLEKWRYMYTGEADRDLKERNLINDIREEAVTHNEVQAKTEFPNGTGLSAMELAKMQRMMTACYFTPKMAIVRKKGKLFFRVGIPRDQDKIYNCPICDDSFNHQRSLNIHMRRHKPQPVRHFHLCATCGETFADRKDLILHKRVHYAGVFDGARMKYRRVQEYYTCGICSCKFSSKSGRNSHIKKYHPNEKIFTCALCFEIFADENGLKGHFDSTHRHIRGLSDNPSHPSELFTCVECSKQFLKIKSLIEHRRVHAVGTLTECYYCGMGFEGLESLQEHTDVTHMDPNPFNCDGCDESFGTEEALIEHMKSKSQRSSTYICETCGRVSRSKEALQKHLLTHATTTTESSVRDTEEQEGVVQVHMCDVCELAFSDFNSLEIHLTQQHHAKLPFKCTVCGDDEGFKDAKDLRKHKIEAHPETLENLPHACTLCWNSFATAEDLETHNTQTHERFKCHICDRVFKLSEHLKRHLLVHTGEKPYKCTMCDKSFNQESNLKEHTYRHQGIRPHRCPHCLEVAFLRRVHLKEHMLVEHGVGLEDVPSLPIGRAAQNARRAGTYPVPGTVSEASATATASSVTPETVEMIKGEEGQSIQVISYGTPITLPQIQKPLIVNDVTVRDDGVHERFAPLIMKSLQNKSNQPIIVRRGIQIPDKTTSPYVAAIQIKSGGITTDGEIIEASDGGSEEGGQQYIIYNV